MSNYSDYLGSKKCCNNNRGPVQKGKIGPQGAAGAQRDAESSIVNVLD